MNNQTITLETELTSNEINGFLANVELTKVSVKLSRQDRVREIVKNF